MSLDLFQQNQTDQIDFARRASAPDLPSTFLENFSDAWSRGFLVQQSVSGDNRKSAAGGEYADEMAARAGDPSLAMLMLAGRDVFNERVEKLKAERPELDIAPLTDDEVQRRADEIGKRQLSESARLAGREGGAAAIAGQLAGGLPAAVADPVNIAAMPLAAPASLGILRTALAWGAIAGGSQAVIEALNTPSMERIQPGYGDSSEPAANILQSVAGGAVLGGGFKTAAALWQRARTGEWPRTIRDAGNVVLSEDQIASTNRFPGAEGEVFHRTALQQAIDDLVSGRPPFDQTPLPEGGILAAYDAKMQPIMEARARAAAASESAITFERDAARLPPTMERLSEVQLSEFRDVASRASAEAASTRSAIAVEQEALGPQQAALAQRGERTAGLTQEIENLRSDLASLDQRIETARPPIDPATQARLDAIDADLKGQIGRDARALLENERAQITETLAKTGPEDRRLLASLNAERKGIAKALARAEKALEKDQGQIERLTEKLAARAAALPRLEAATTQREAGKLEAAANGLRRAVARLAEDGYGIRLTREEAEGFASRILSASEQEADDVLRGVTEDLVSRGVEARRALPAELPGIGRPVPAAEQKARAGYHTEQMRKGITALAREVGYEMPREEAATIAAQLARLPEQEAMAVLDELLLRPRTLADTLPGTGAAKAPASDQAPKINITETERALADDLTPKRIEELRTDQDVADTIQRDLDKLRAEKGDFEIPTGVQVDADGKATATTRKIDSIIAEAEERELAAKEILACVGPYPKEAAE